jgi:hypothetical protein
LHLLFAICCGNSAQCEQGSEFFCAWGVYPHGMSLESFPCVHIFICMTLLVSTMLGIDLVPHDNFHIIKANDFYILAQPSLGVTHSLNQIFESIFLFLSFCKILCIAKKSKCSPLDIWTSKVQSMSVSSIKISSFLHYGFAYLLSYKILEYENLN